MAQVETFFCEESQDLITEPEELDKWKNQIESLELEGQKKLTEEDKSPVAFRPMSSEERHIYETLLGKKDDIKLYSHEVIPVRALSAVALAKQEGYFKKIEVWYDKEYVDPLIVGLRPDPEATWRDIPYMIARFGPVLKSLEELRIDAKNKLISKAKADLEVSISERQAQMNNLNSLVDSFLRGNSVNFLH